MTASKDTLRRLATLALVVSLLVAIASCVGLLASFVEPALELSHLYWISTLTREIGFCMLAAYIIAGFALPTKADPRATANMSGWTSKALSIIVLGCFVIIIFSPHTYVYPQAGGWITKSKAGTFSISADIARHYLWRAVRMWSAIPFGVSLAAMAFMWKLARQAPQE
jgi:hypothetical protein